MGFAHLHVHSQYSILDGTADPAGIAARAKALGMSAVALTDSCNLYGAVAFFKACKSQGIKPIIGAELHVQPEGLDFADPMGVEGGHQLVVLVENELGYKNLCALITAAIFDGMQYKPRVDDVLLRKHAAGLIALAGGRKGAFGKDLLAGRVAQASERIRQLVDVFGPKHLFLELQDHGLAGEEQINEGLRALAAEAGLQSVVTNAVHYLRPEDSPIHEVLNAVSAGCSLSDVRRVISHTDQAYFKSEAEMRELFPNDPESIALTAEIADRCNYSFDFGTYHFPATTPPDVDEEGNQPDTDGNWSYFYRAFPPPRDYGLPDPSEAVPRRPEGAGNLNGYFEWYCQEGLKLRLSGLESPDEEAYEQRLAHEMKIIERMGFPAYMLIVAEFINWSKDNEIPVGPGRGSAAGSLVAWAMRITDIDPIRFGLLFERFLNPERVSMPDIDVDFCQDRREEAIEHVRVKYGADYVSQIITYGKLKAKAAVRDVARVLDLTFMEADRIAKLVPDTLGITLAEAVEQESRLEQLRHGDPKVRRVLNVAMGVEGLCRQTGVHAAGVVIADRPLVEYAPLYRDEPEGGPVVQYDMKSAESIGLIKFDFLGLKTLDQIRDAVAMVRRNTGEAIDMSRIPWDDETTYQLLQAGDALGVFQLESSGMRELLTRLRPNCMDDMVALVALYRPGPLQSGMVDDFVDRKHGRKDVVYPLPILEQLLKPTYGTIIYQEQVMQIAQVMAGYSLGEADLLRRAMGKKKQSEMDKQRSRFVGGSVESGISAEKAGEIFDLLAKFAAYGFNKSHSAAYGYISYQTAYLKAHYRPEYMAALMTIEAANTDKVLNYIADCRRAGLTIAPVCVNHSEWAFDVPNAGEALIRFGLAAVKNVGQGAIEAVLESRQQAGGRFRDVTDFFRRVDYKRVNRRVIESLIKAGALDFGGVCRAALLTGLEDAMAMGARHQQDQASGQVGLFSMLAPAARPVDFRWPAVAALPLSQRLQFEREVLGLYLTGHPMQAHGKDVERYATASIGALAQLDPSLVDEVRVLGLVVDQRVIRTRRGDKMAFIKLEDTEGSVEVTFFSEPWSRSQRALQAAEPVLITGSLEARDDEVKLLAASAEPLTELRARSTRMVRIEVPVEELANGRLTRFHDLLREYPGVCQAYLVLTFRGRFTAELDLPSLRLEPSPALEERVNALFGAEVVSLA